MQASLQFTCVVTVTCENADGTTSTATLAASAADIRRHFAPTLAPGTLVSYLLAQAGYASAGVRDSPEPVDLVLLSRVHLLMQQRLGEAGLSVEDLAAELEMSPRHLRRRLHELTGEPPKALLRRARVERAEMLLRCGMPSLKEVAHAVGYRSREGLRRAMAAVRGSPPPVARAE